jgi:hypothetical protein
VRALLAASATLTSASTSDGLLRGCGAGVTNSAGEMSVFITRNARCMPIVLLDWSLERSTDKVSSLCWSRSTAGALPLVSLGTVDDAMMVLFGGIVKYVVVGTLVGNRMDVRVKGATA